MFGLATDDSHDYLEYRTTTPNPGRGWIMVRAPELSAPAIVAAMERGDFYSTSGVMLRDVRREGDRLRRALPTRPSSSARGAATMHRAKRWSTPPVTR